MAAQLPRRKNHGKSYFVKKACIDFYLIKRARLATCGFWVFFTRTLPLALSMMNLPFRTAALVVLAVWPVVAASGAAKVKSCKCFPGETCWPSEATWDSFNATVGGRLIKTVPLGSPCHDPSYNETECAKLQANWRRVPIQ